MAIDPRIILAQQDMNIAGAAQAGIMGALEQQAARENIDLADLQQKQAQQEIDKAKTAQMANGARYTLGALNSLKNLPPDQRQPAWDIHAAKLSSMGFDPSAIRPEEISTDEGLKRSIDFITPYAARMEGKLAMQPWGGTYKFSKDGKDYVGGMLYNESTGELRNVSEPLGGRFTSGGETPEQAEARRIREERAKAEIDRQNAIDKANQTSTPLADAAAKKTTAEEASKIEIKNSDDLLKAGTNAMDAERDLKIAKDLLAKIDTGGFESVALQAKNWLGIDSKATIDQNQFRAMAADRVLNGMALLKGTATQKDADLVARREFNFEVGNGSNMALIDRFLGYAASQKKRGETEYSRAKEKGLGHAGVYSQYYEGQKPSQATAAPQATEQEKPLTPEERRALLRNRSGQQP